MILESLSNPDHHGLTITQRCELLGISRGTWWRHRRDPLFRARSARAVRDLCYDRLGPVLQALTDVAARPDEKCHQDRKLFLELIGEHTPGEKRDEEEKKATGGLMSPEDYLTFLEGNVERLPAGYRRLLGLDPHADPETLPALRIKLAGTLKAAA